MRSTADAASTVYVPYVEDTTSFGTALLVNNPGLVPANVTVTLVDADDPSGPSSGTASSRDIPVPINGATSIPDVVRWVLGETTATTSGKRGFLVVTTPQAVTAQAKIVDTVTLDPAVPETETSLTSAFSPLLVRVEPLPFAAVAAMARSPMALAAVGATGTTLSRFALSNPGASPATVELAAVNASGGAPTQPFVMTLAPNGQFFTDDAVPVLAQ